ncbi:unnamed protein product [Durusdinium trenchii]|uniref:Uncharacterized protein n=2 Tax=Durusdinium trenchii TaxID=1381693 RepID=A0ABP0IA12_9DINO
MQQRTTLNLNRAVLPEDQEAFFNPNAVPQQSSVLSPMSAYFDGPQHPPSFFGAAHATGPAPVSTAASSAAPGTGGAAASPASSPHPKQVRPQQVCLQAGLAAPFVPYQSMPPGVALPVNPGLQPMCNLPAGAPAPAPVAPASSAGTGGNPTLLQSRPAPKKEAKEETKRAAQGRAPCPIGVYVDLSSLRLREKSK